MPLIDVQCLEPTCGHIFEHVRPIADWPATPPCEKCQSPNTDDGHLPPRTRWSVDPVVVFEAPDGTYRYPGEADGNSSRRYAAAGYRQITIRNATEMRAFETRVGIHEQRKANETFERSERAREASESARRGALHTAMASMSPRGRDLARAAIAQSDGVRRAAHQVGFHSEVYNVDRSNRGDSRDTQGRRRRD